MIVLILGSQIIGNAASYGQAYLTAFSGQKMVATFRARMFDRIARMPLREFDRWRPGELQSRMSADLGLMTDAISISLPQFVQVTVTFIAALVYMIARDWFLAVVLFVAAPVIAFVVSKFNALIVTGTRRAQERIADLSSNLIEVLANERVVKAFRREDFERDRFAAANERYFGAYMKVTQFNQTQTPVLSFVVMVALCAVIGFTAREVSVGHLTPSTAWGFWVADGAAHQPDEPLLDLLRATSRARSSAPGACSRSSTCRSSATIRPTRSRCRTSSATSGSRTSRSRTTTGRRCSRTSPPRCCTARSSRWWGRRAPARARSSTWCRASTSRRAGGSRVDGVDIARVRLGDLRDAIAIVPQETQLFNGTIADNIRYGRLDARDDEIVAAAVEANADEFVRKLSDGYDTLVGERGIRLSGGQRQRIAIARAILRDPRILILDEATSALDSHSEALIEDALDRLLPGRTTLIIAHRLSTIRRATKILYIEGGRVRETGTHDDLIAAGGPYANLHAAQFTR